MTPTTVQHVFPLPCASYLAVHSKLTMRLDLFKLTFTHRAEGGPGLVRPAGDGAAAFHLLTFGASDTNRLTDIERLLGYVSAFVLLPGRRSRARLGCEGHRVYTEFGTFLSLSLPLVNIP